MYECGCFQYFDIMLRYDLMMIYELWNMFMEM